MIVGVGVDLVQQPRLRRLRERWGRRFLARVFTPAECALCESRADPVPSLAARFAAKEAAMKALGTGWGAGVGWHDVEVGAAESGAPRLHLHRAAAERARTLGASRWHVSLSHDGDAAVAVVILEGE